MSEMVDEKLWSDCYAFVSEQSEGEWGDYLIRRDTRKLYDFVKSRVDAAMETHPHG